MLKTNKSKSQLHLIMKFPQQMLNSLSLSKLLLLEMLYKQQLELLGSIIAHMQPLEQQLMIVLFLKPVTLHNINLSKLDGLLPMEQLLSQLKLLSV
jgi:hypothetical protein